MHGQPAVPGREALRCMDRCRQHHRCCRCPLHTCSRSPCCTAPPLAQVGRLWTSLADYFIRRGMFERARDVYEEGLTSVITVRDFSLVYDALTQVRRGPGQGRCACCCAGQRGQAAAAGRALEEAGPRQWQRRPPCPPSAQPLPAHPHLAPIPNAPGQFEESLISAKMEQLAGEEEPPEEEDGDDGQDFLLKDGGDDLDMR